MTAPTQMNCSHIGDGWCLACVRELSDERDVLKKAALDLAFDSGDYSAILDDLAAREADVTRLRALLAYGVESLQFGGEPKTVLGRAVREFTEKAQAELEGAK